MEPYHNYEWFSISSKILWNRDSLAESLPHHVKNPRNQTVVRNPNRPSKQLQHWLRIASQQQWKHIKPFPLHLSCQQKKPKQQRAYRNRPEDEAFPSRKQRIEPRIVGKKPKKPRNNFAQVILFTKTQISFITLFYVVFNFIQFLFQ